MTQPTLDPNDISHNDIRYLVGRLHVSTSNLGVCREIFKRAKQYTKDQRKRAYKYALEVKRADDDLYNFATSGGHGYTGGSNQ